VASLGRRRRLHSSVAHVEGTLDVTVILLEGGYASTAIGPIEVFHSAGTLWNRLHGEAQTPRFRVRIASLDGKNVTGFYPLGLVPECSIKDIRHTDIIIVPTSGWDVQELIAKSTPLLPWLRKWHARGAYVAGVCTGVAFLAEAGLLDGKCATTHWAMADVFSTRYPKVRWQIEQFVTEDRRVMCSGGIYASIDLSLYLVEKFCGHEIALQCARSLLVSMPRGRQSGYAVLPLSRPHEDERVREVEDWLRQNFDRDVSIDRLAARAGMGTRNFIRRFKAATGRLPGAYVQMLRISAARELLERGTPSIQTVCSKTGYEDVAFFRSLFKRHTGMTPAEYRARFAAMTFDRGELTATNLKGVSASPTPPGPLPSSPR
jgi:transcriptional regulator GlxA family with amidase domain